MGEKIKCLIIGSGPAGYTAAIYAARANMSPVLYQGIQPGGQLTTTTDVENFPGYPKGISGPEMMVELQQQAERFGTDVRNGWITKVDFNNDLKLWVNDQDEIICETVIIATGASAKYLGLPSEKKYLELGGGVSACAVCDGFFYKGQEVAIVGAGDSACEEAHYLSKLCNKVNIIVRKDKMRASHIMRERVEKINNINILYNSKIEEILGDNTGVTGVKLINNQNNETSNIDVHGVFLAIGHVPNTKFVEGLVDLDEHGFVKTNRDLSTNVKGIWAAGDVQDPKYKQAITAAGTGCQAALEAQKYIESKE